MQLQRPIEFIEADERIANADLDRNEKGSDSVKSEHVEVKETV